MADEDEIDILGEFSLDNLLSKSETGLYENSVLSQNSELLSCDYTLNSQWLLDTTTNNTDCWYSNPNNDYNNAGNSETNTSLGFDEVICPERTSIDDTGWTEDEKSSLTKGLEIFGKNALHLSQFIASKTPAQVKHYLKNCYTKSVCNVSLTFNNVYNTIEINNSSQFDDVPLVFNSSDIIEDAQIPASIEEVIAVVSTAKPTVKNISKKSIFGKKKDTNYKNSSPKKHKSVDYSLFQNSSENKKRTKVEKEFNIEEEKIDFLPVASGEEVIKLKKENSASESEAEIEVDVDEEVTTNKIQKKEEIINHKKESNTEIDNQNTNEKETETVKPIEEDESIINTTDLIANKYKNASETVLNFLTSVETPAKEIYIDDNVITEVEKYIHSEFFEGRPTKTPDRYLKIRNHIVDYWIENKPSYCTKTAVRQGLKNCGDVNCIGRIHSYLEQIGAINFGCVQTNYIRPIINLMVTQQPREKPAQVQQIKIDYNRSRKKKKYNNDGGGGYTIMHDENGEIIDTTIINEEKQKPRTNRRQNIKLIFCKNFTDEHPAPYSVTLHLNALLLIDMHAHSATIEVMGLLGGIYDKSNKELHITRYIPCKGLEHSNTHCDMCPISQSEASEILMSEGVEVIGWFHSHPTFYPNPSFQDIDTQLNMQTYLSSDHKPFVGVILSPFRSLAGSYASEYRCLIVKKNEIDNEDTGTPYKFQINLSSSYFDLDLFLQQARELFNMKNNIEKQHLINFQKKYFQDSSITNLEKLIASIKLHLARFSEINKMTCDAIIEGITEICLKK